MARLPASPEVRLGLADLIRLVVKLKTVVAEVGNNEGLEAKPEG